MSVVRGHVVVIRRALPWHSASLPVSNLREGRLRFRQPWEQLFAAGAQPSNSANLNKTVFNLSSQSHNIYHKASRHYASSTLQFPLLPDGLHNRRGTEALECERPHGATIDLSADNDIIYQVVNLVVTFLFVFFFTGEYHSGKIWYAPLLATLSSKFLYFAPHVALVIQVWFFLWLLPPQPFFPPNTSVSIKSSST